MNYVLGPISVFRPLFAAYKTAEALVIKHVKNAEYNNDMEEKIKVSEFNRAIEF
ncbi:hypothetical protein ACK8P5_18905 [Paenibacillus sp. EC2-1]|uniref:hypothetical protein n=1 Tax=Paenibacillus sp. EC2-1 TaxID=3388665 RepID=UPI003BEEC55B